MIMNASLVKSHYSDAQIRDHDKMHSRPGRGNVSRRDPSLDVRFAGDHSPCSPPPEITGSASVNNNRRWDGSA